MTFLNPAALIGLFAGLIPIALHFINLKKLKRIEFSTLYFMEELKKSKIRKLKLRQWILLLLRLLLVIFLVLAFAKPAVRSSIGIAGERAKITALFILDDSPSMNAVTERGSVFSLAKTAAKEAAAQLSNNDDVYLESASGSFESLPKINREKLIEEIKTLQPTDVHSSIFDRITEGIDFIGKAKTLKKELFIFSDFQKTNFDSSALRKAVTENPDFNIYLFPMRGIAKRDFSISAFELKSKLLAVNAPIRFLINETGSGIINGENRISLFVNDKRVAQSSAAIAPNETKSVELTANIGEGGFVSAVAKLSDDDLLFNNNAYLSFYLKSERNILLISSRKNQVDFVRLALSAASELHNKIKSVNFVQSDYENLYDYDVVFAVNPPLGLMNRIGDYVRKGGGLVLFPSEKSADNFKDYLRKFSTAEFYGVSNKSASFPILFDKVNLSDPLFEGLFKNSKNSQIISPKIIKHLKIKGNGAGRKIITLEDKSAFLSRYSYGKGKVFFFNVPPTTNWSDFPVTPIFAPLMNRIVLYLTSSESSANSIFAGDEYRISRELFTAPTLKIITPKEKEIIINPDELKNKNFYTFRKTDFSGIYKIYSGRVLSGEFSVNVSPVESTQKYFSSKELKEKIVSLGKKSQVRIISQRKNYANTLVSESTGSALWRLFLSLSLLCAILEMIVARTSKKEFLNFVGR